MRKWHLEAVIETIRYLGFGDKAVIHLDSLLVVLRDLKDMHGIDKHRVSHSNRSAGDQKFIVYRNRQPCWDTPKSRPKAHRNYTSLIGGI